MKVSDLNTVKKNLVGKGYDEKKVSIYTSYLNRIINEKDKDKKQKNAWVNYFTIEQSIERYEKVAIDDPLFIDGDTITLAFRGRVIINYGYQAYRNRVLISYPDSKFDISLVYSGDKFSFKKQSGEVIYTHEMTNPFSNEEKIIGAYCIIKNARGTVFERLNTSEISKLNAVSKMNAIWKTWFGEMVLKSVIKRACKRNFYDITKNMHKVDNEGVDLDQKTPEVKHNVDEISQIKKEVDKKKTLDDLFDYFKSKPSWALEDDILDIFTKRKEQILSEQKQPVK